MIKAKKSLGQNFLQDNNVLKKIVSLINIKNKNIIEIGPGTGNLTDKILENNPNNIILIEKDYKLCEILYKKYKLNNRIKIINKDILLFDIENIIKKKTIIFGNLPYNISTQILLKFVKFKKWPPNYIKLILMFQKEVADRIIAKHNTPEYGRLKIITGLRLNSKKCFNISKNCFFPKPKVESSVISLEPKSNIKFKIKKISNLEKITHIFFSNKRKMINKAFSKIFKNPEIVSQKLNIDLSLRPNQINENEFYKIVNFFESDIN